MTNEEAIRLLRSNITAECLFCDGVKNFGCNSKCLSLKALDIAIKSLRKQSKKNMIFINNKQIYGYKCPSCHTFYSLLKGVDTDAKYCKNCGQKIDWGDNV